MKPGYRVVRKGWERYEHFHHLARRGTIMSAPFVLGPGYPPGYTRLVEVRWDAAINPLGEPRTMLEPVNELSWQWWRST